MSKESLQRIAYTLAIIALGVFLFEKVYEAYRLFNHVVLLFSMAWLIAFSLGPLADRLENLPVRVRTREFNVPRIVAVTLIYTVLFVLALGAGLYLFPLIQEQVVQFTQSLVAFLNDFPRIVGDWQKYLAERAIDIDLARTFLVESDLIRTLAQSATDFSSYAVQNVPALAAGLINGMIDSTIVLVMSFYMILDGPSLITRTVQAMPDAWQDDAWVFVRVVDRRFGSFIRILIIQAALYGLGTAILMSVTGLEYSAIASLLSAVLIIVPLVGGWLAVILPVTIALFHNPVLAVGVWIALIIMQQLLFHVIMPRLTGSLVGIHPLLVFLAVLMGFPVAGLWGSLFAIPVTGVIVSIVEFIRARMNGDPVEAAVLPERSKPRTK